MNKRNKFILALSKWCIYSWLILGIIMFFLVFNDYTINNLLITYMMTSLVFVPLYLVIFSSLFNRNYKYRIILSFLFLIPIILSYYEISMVYNSFNIMWCLGIGLLFLLLNFSMLIGKSYLPITIFTILNSLLFIVVNVLYKKFFVSSEILIEAEGALTSIIIMMCLLSMSMAFLYHTSYLLYYKRVN